MLLNVCVIHSGREVMLATLPSMTDLVYKTEDSDGEDEGETDIAAVRFEVLL